MNKSSCPGLDLNSAHSMSLQSRSLRGHDLAMKYHYLFIADRAFNIAVQISPQGESRFPVRFFAFFQKLRVLSHRCKGIAEEL